MTHKSKRVFVNYSVNAWSGIYECGNSLRSSLFLKPKTSHCISWERQAVPRGNISARKGEMNLPHHLSSGLHQHNKDKSVCYSVLHCQPFVKCLSTFSYILLSLSAALSSLLSVRLSLFVALFHEVFNKLRKLML